MASIELAYPHQEVRTPEQVQLLIDYVLAPAADIIEGSSFLESSSYQVERGQTRSARDEPGGWVSTGFQATRIDLGGDGYGILYNVWTYNALDTAQIPFPQEAITAANIHSQGESLILTEVLAVDDDDDEVEIEVQQGDEVVEQYDFFINNQRLTVVRDFDFAYVRNGTIVWKDSCRTDTIPETTDKLEKFAGLESLEDGLDSSFNFLDLEMIAKILGSLGLLTSAQ